MKVSKKEGALNTDPVPARPISAKTWPTTHDQFSISEFILKKDVPFPILTDLTKNNTEVIDLINTTMQKTLFEKSFSDKAWSNEQEKVLLLKNIYSITYEVATPTQRILGIAFSIDTCNSICQLYDEFFFFDIKTGNRLTLEALTSSKEAKEKVLQDATSYHKKKVEEILAIIKQRKAAAQENHEEEDMLDNQLAFYSECLLSPANYINNDGREFKISSSSLIIINHCSNFPTALRSYNELGKTFYTINFETLEPYLSPYGRELILTK